LYGQMCDCWEGMVSRGHKARLQAASVKKIF
jgi:hypothetical protein